MRRFFVLLLPFIIVNLIVFCGINYYNKDKNNDKTLISYYVETGEGTGVYEKQEGTTWPEGYVLNEEKSSCDNGSTLSWDSETNSVVVTANKEDSCKVYMDKENSYLIFDFGISSGKLSLNNVDITSRNNEKVEYQAGDVLNYTHSGACSERGLKIYDKDHILLKQISNSWGYDYDPVILVGNERYVEEYMIPMCEPEGSVVVDDGVIVS